MADSKLMFLHDHPLRDDLISHAWVPGDVNVRYNSKREVVFSVETFTKVNIGMDVDFKNGEVSLYLIQKTPKGVQHLDLVYRNSYFFSYSVISEWYNSIRKTLKI